MSKFLLEVCNTSYLSRFFFKCSVLTIFPFWKIFFFKVFAPQVFFQLPSKLCYFMFDMYALHAFLQEWKSCAVGCKFQFNANQKSDATFGVAQQPGTANVLRSMESSHYYSENNIDLARRWVSTLRDDSFVVFDTLKEQASIQKRSV